MKSYSDKQAESKASPRQLLITGDKKLIQRKCACGESAGIDGQCETCRSRRLGSPRSLSHGVPSLLEGRLASAERTGPKDNPGGSGTPLDAGTRATLEDTLSYDFSRVRVHTDEEADRLARSVDATAFTYGQDIFFRDGTYNPHRPEGLHLIAHEAAHTMQQSTAQKTDTSARNEISVGDPADSLEQEADRAAHDVISRGSRPAHSPIVAAGRPTIQKRSAVHKPSEKVETNFNTASNTLQAVADVLHYGELRLLGAVDPKYQNAILDLQVARTGKRNDRSLSADECLQVFESALVKLHPVFAALEKDKDQKDWLAIQVTPYVHQLREDLNVAKAKERIKQAEASPEETSKETPGEENPREQAAELSLKIPELLEGLHTVAEWIGKLNEESLKEGKEGTEAAHEVEEVIGNSRLKKVFNFKTLDELSHVLGVMTGFLKLTDKEFKEKLHDIHKYGAFHDVATYAEFVKTVLDIVSDVTSLTASLSAIIAKVAGYAELAAKISSVAEKGGKALGTVVKVIDIVHGLSVLRSKKASTEDKQDAVADILVDVTSFASAPASIALRITYLELKLIANLYGQALLGVTGTVMNSVFHRMKTDAESIGAAEASLATAMQLFEAEKNLQQRRALALILNQKASDLGSSIDSFLVDCKPMGIAGNITNPGAYSSLMPVFAPLLPLIGMNTPRARSDTAIAILTKIHWCFEHAQALVRQEAGLPPEKQEKKEHEAGKKGEHE